MTEPTARNPWTVTLAWTPDQNFGAVSVYPSRSPLFAVLGSLSAGETPAAVADEYGCGVEAVEVLVKMVEAGLIDNRTLVEEPCDQCEHGRNQHVDDVQQCTVVGCDCEEWWSL